MLHALLAMIESSDKALTPGELAQRLDIEAGQIVAMLATLRAHGRLVPDLAGESPVDVCSGAGLCGGTCPGPADCQLVADTGLVPLQLTSPPARLGEQRDPLVQ